MYPSRAKAVLVMLLAAAVPACSQSGAGEFGIETGRVGRIHVGMSVDEFYRVYPPGQARLVDLFLEGMFSPALQVLRGAGLMLTAGIDKRDGRWIISNISVYDYAFETAEGLRVGSTLAEVRKAHPRTPVHMGEGQWYAVVSALGLSFALDADTTRPAGDSARVTAILVYTPPPNREP